MEHLLSRNASSIYALLRVVAGLLFAAHGAQKIFGFFGGTEVQPGTLMGVAGIIELLGGVCIALGLFTRPLAFLSSGEMAVAYFMAHAPLGPWPILNKGELAVLYAFLFLHVASRGAGAYSLDALLSRGHNRFPFRLRTRAT